MRFPLSLRLLLSLLFLQTVHFVFGSYESFGLIGSDERKRRSNRPSAVVPSPSSPTDILRPFYSPNAFSVLSDDPQSVQPVKNDLNDRSSFPKPKAKENVVLKTFFTAGMTYDEWRKGNALPDMYTLAYNDSMREYRQIMNYEMEKLVSKGKGEGKGEGKWTADMIHVYVEVANQYEEFNYCSESTTEEKAQWMMQTGNSPLAKGSAANAINEPNGIQPFMYIRDFFVNYYVHVVEAKAKAKAKAKNARKEEETGQHLREAKNLVKEQDKSSTAQQILFAFFLPELESLMLYLNDWHQFVLSRKYAQHHTTEEIKQQVDVLSKAVHYLNVLRFYVFNVSRAYYATEEQTLAFLRNVDFEIPRLYPISIFEDFVGGAVDV